MATTRERVFNYLSKHKGGIDDDELAVVLNLSRRQQANTICRQLASEGIIERKYVKGKINNFWIEHKQTLTEKKWLNTAEPWFWEGNVQIIVAIYLEEQGYKINQFADTAKREKGKDIEAQKGDNNLWVTVKGYPKGTPRTSPSTQAGHWFKKALFDIVAWRGESETAQIAMALPDYPRYRKLAEKVAWLQLVARFTFFWVQESGLIIVE